MKYIRYIDATLQSLLVLIAAVVLAAIAFGENEYLLLILYVQLVMGPLQYVGSFLSLFYKGEVAGKRRIHLALSTVYLAFFFAMPREFYESRWLLCIIPWTLAVFCLIVTLQSFRSTGTGKGFLPHLSF